MHHGLNVNFFDCDRVREDNPFIRNRYLCHLQSYETLLIHPNVVARIPEVPHEIEDAFKHGIDKVHSGLELKSYPLHTEPLGLSTRIRLCTTCR